MQFGPYQYPHAQQTTCSGPYRLKLLCNRCPATSRQPALASDALSLLQYISPAILEGFLLCPSTFACINDPVQCSVTSRSGLLCRTRHHLESFFVWLALFRRCADASRGNALAYSSAAECTADCGSLSDSPIVQRTGVYCREHGGRAIHSGKTAALCESNAAGTGDSKRMSDGDRRRNAHKTPPHDHFPGAVPWSRARGMGRTG